MIQRTNQTPTIQAPGIVFGGGSYREAATGEPVWMDLVAAFPQDERTPADWLRALFVTCVSEGNQVPFHASLLKDRILFPDELEDRTFENGVTATVVPLHFDLCAELGTLLQPERYCVQVSAGRFRSEVIVLEIN